MTKRWAIPGLLGNSLTAKSAIWSIYHRYVRLLRLWRSGGVLVRSELEQQLLFLNREIIAKLVIAVWRHDSLGQGMR
jgi:hypothetical protein